MLDAAWRALATLAHRGVPAQCRVCHAWPAQTLCAACRQAFVRPRARCGRCALPWPPDAPPGPMCPDCAASPGGLDACVAAVDYDYPWNDLLVQYKFGGTPGDAPGLADLLRAAPGARALLAQHHWIVPVPLSAARLRQRGFNQAWELARHLGTGRARHDLLVRRWDTPAQSGLHRDARWVNLHHALRVPRAQAARVAGRRILLVDDVMTTGATLQAASQALRDAGARTVAALVVARAAKSGHAERRPGPS